jgi:hypothetical protein
VLKLHANKGYRVDRVLAHARAPIEAHGPDVVARLDTPLHDEIGDSAFDSLSGNFLKF